MPSAKRSLRIAIDAMGGDHGPSVTVAGAALAIERHPQASILLFGNEPAIAPLLARRPALAARARVIHCDNVIAMDDKPGQALRRGKGSSLWQTLAAVSEGEAEVAVSAGNTGALMAIAKFLLRPVAEIERPAIAAIWPTVRAESIVLDVGANIGASSRQLVDYAIMGAGMARALFGLERPKVGLLNVGVEEIKGNEEVREAHQLMKEVGDLPLEYVGFVEGDQIGQGFIDVVVVEGFAGNIALKTAEGTARQLASYLRSAMRRSLLSRVGAYLAADAFGVLKRKMDPSHSNGGTFLGLNGLAIKSHGGADAVGFASAIDIGHDMAEAGLVERLTSDLEHFHGLLAVATQPNVG